jgi:hypothetical protein
MNEILLPNTKERIDLDVLLALCDELGQDAGRKPLAASVEPMPIYLSAVSLAERLQQHAGYAYSFDVACRLMSSQRNMMQATNPFFEHPGNGTFFEKVSYPNGLTGNTVHCARFTSRCIEFWEALTPAARESAHLRAQALLNGDVDDDKVEIVVEHDKVDRTEAEAPTACLKQGNGTRSSMIEALVAKLHADAFTASYRKKPLDKPAVAGWDQRLQSYFWPSPQSGYDATAKSLESLQATGKALARIVEKQSAWSSDEEALAVQFARDVFAWGGVPQDPDTVTAINVRAVFADALANDAQSKALMNSGWTKVAAFATAHLEEAEGGKPQVIWDSRVATSLIDRLHALAADGEHSNMRDQFPHIGTIPGQGGTRPRSFQPGWPSGYRKWTSQVNGSALVREIRDVLNTRKDLYPPMPLPGNTTGPWTTRGVEMVLFMDGY